jgi:hypothetical protein
VAFFIAIFITATALMMGLMAMDSTGIMVGAVFTAIAALVLTAGFAVGYGLLSAHQWARWTGIVLAGLMTLAEAAGVIGIIAGAVAVAANEGPISEFFQQLDSQNSPDGAAPPPAQDFQNMLYALLGFYGLPIVVGLVLAGTALWALLNRATASWFRFAAQVRAEHRLVRERLAE